MHTLKLRGVAFVVLAVLGIRSVLYAQSVTVDDVMYHINTATGTAELVKGTNARGHLNIPEFVSFQGKEYKVTGIGKLAFSSVSMTKANRNLTGITIPNTITHIGNYAFANCVLLKEVTIPNSVTTIGEYGIFEGCTSLTSVVVPDQEPRVKANGGRIQNNVFDRCETVTSVRGNTIAYPTYVYNCGKKSGNNREFNGWLDSDCPFMKSTYPKLLANGFQEPTGETAVKADVAQHTVKKDVSSASRNVVHTAKSDVDINIPQNDTKSENTFAVIIANENYQEVSKVPNAINDGTVFAEYCKKSLGIPATNVHLVTDATYNNIRREVAWLQKVAQAYKGDAKIIVYYAGHGVPDEASRTSYLLPVDGLGNDAASGYSLKDFYQTLSEIPSKSVMVFLDACFSGATRDGGMMASARGVAIKAKAEKPQGKLVVFSAAEGDETAYPYTENCHGMFTYFLLKKIQQTKGNVTLGDLAEYVKDNVGKKSIVVNGKSQTPTVSSSSALGEKWKNWKLR